MLGWLAGFSALLLVTLQDWSDAAETPQAEGPPSLMWIPAATEAETLCSISAPAIFDLQSHVFAAFVLLFWTLGWGVILHFLTYSN